MQANPGVYALLIGSGVSQAAQIPTGWEITLDLIRKVASTAGDAAEPDPDLWYQDKYGEAPDYSQLLDVLAKTPTERQQLLRPYVEATDQEREEGSKQPTSAHQAIARLAAQGFVKVIITTNFDRLIETALEDEGIVPTVLSSPDQVTGALPLIHTKCCVFKVHGDYLDTRIRNSPAELQRYPQEFNQLLDRIFDEFGLIVCGWSAEWDSGLRDAILRASSRRFTTYWALRGNASDEARKLVNHRRAQVIDIEAADSFFHAIQQSVESIQQFSRPHPLSTEAAVASLKRYLSEPRYRIQLADLVREAVERVVAYTSSEAFDMHRPDPNTETVSARVRAYEEACSTLLAMAVVGGRWAEQEHIEVWQQSLERLATVSLASGKSMWLGLRLYPATVLLYALGLGALSAERLHFLGRIFSTTVFQQDSEQDMPVVRLLPPFCWQSIGGRAMRILEGMESKYAPLNDWIHGVLRDHTASILPNDLRYSLVFDRLEILMALSFAYYKKRLESAWYWAPPGAFGYRDQNRQRTLREIEESLSTLQDESPFVESRIFGVTAENCRQSLDAFGEFSDKVAAEWV